MDRFFDRLGDIIKGFLDDEDQGLFGSSSHQNRGRGFTDPDLDAAFEELDDYLKGGSSDSSSAKNNRGSTSGANRSSDSRSGRQGSAGATGDYSRGSNASSGGYSQRARDPSAPPESLRKDFAELGVPFGSDEATCKGAYKKLLKVHHPDRHAGHPGNMRKATEKSARINASYQRIEKWRETGTPD